MWAVRLRAPLRTVRIPPLRRQEKRKGKPVSSSRVYTRFFLATLRDVFFVLAFFFGAARFLAATLFVTFFFAGEVVVAPSPASALAPLAALACIAVATVPMTTLAAAEEAAFAVAPAVAAALAASPASTLVLSAALFPAATTVSRTLVMVPLLFISAPPSLSRGRVRRGRYTDFSLRHNG
jgi:hypothetical protein